MQAFQDAFISYGRKDSLQFATQLRDRLAEAGLTVWFDFRNIPKGVDYQKQIDDGIERSDNFLFVIAPHSIHSPYCRKEIELAVKRNKRIIPLMHVEQISRETWQERCPTGTDQDWELYTSKQLHTSFCDRMHPEIGKINWIYFREGVDDFEASFTDLLDLCHQHAAYVKQHTYFLVKALEWERQQKQSRFLLIGDDRQQAETWLKTTFPDSQPPCLPTDLHCELISESIKNANNLMTQVFLAHATDDRSVVEKIRKSLLRQGFTVWLNTTDIQTGAVFQNVIDRGIEEADNVVYLISPESIASEYCQLEINLALSVNKRIIPILVKPTDPSLMPPALKDLQYIDLTDLSDEKYEQGESQLIRILRQDAAYHEEHKVLLAKALKWERQQRNPSILLRGYNLNHAEAWLKVAKQNTQYPPTRLQEEFIAESLRQPPGASLDVFVSYSRADSGFARRLNDELQSQGKTTWFDQESIASGSDFQEEIYRGIENSSHFLFILSPNAIASPYCADEVEYAAKLNKRFVTVLHRSVNPADLHPELAKVQWIDFNKHDGDFATNFKELLRTLDTDPVYLRTHTRLLIRAIEWDSHQRDESYLLRGVDFRDAEIWREQSESKQPKPTELQLAYLDASREAEAEKLRLKARRRAMWIVLVITQLTTFIPFVGGFYWLYQSATATAIDRLREDLENTMEAAANEIDGDLLIELSKENTPQPEGYSQTRNQAYWDHVNWLATVEEIEPRAYAYTYVAGDQPNSVVFIGSGSAVNRYRQRSDGTVTVFEGAKFLQFYQPPQTSQIYRGLSTLTIDTQPHTDTWGEWLTGYMPIKNSAGEAVAAIGIDFSADEVVKVQTQIKRSFLMGSIVVGAWMIISSFIILKVTFPADEQQLAKKKAQKEKKAAFLKLKAAKLSSSP